MLPSPKLLDGSGMWRHVADNIQPSAMRWSMVYVGHLCVSFQSCASELRTASQVDALKIFIGYLFSRSLLSFHATPKDRQTNTSNSHINFVYAAEFVSIFFETVIRDDTETMARGQFGLCVFFFRLLDISLPIESMNWMAQGYDHTTMFQVGWVSWNWRQSWWPVKVTSRCEKWVFAFQLGVARILPNLPQGSSSKITLSIFTIICRENVSQTELPNCVHFKLSLLQQTGGRNRHKNLLEIQWSGFNHIVTPPWNKFVWHCTCQL